MTAKTSRLIRFAKTAGWYGAGSVALATLLFAISIYEHLTSKNVAAYWLLFAASAFFCFGAFKAWDAVDDSHHPRLSLVLQQAFFDVVRPFGSNSVIVEIHTFVEITNAGNTETVIKGADLIFCVEDAYFKGNLDRSSAANAIEHFTNFRIGGEISTDIFKNTLSPFRSLTQPNSRQVLSPGSIKEGFLTFSFPDLKTWNPESPYQIDVNSVKLSVTDSYDRTYSTEVGFLHIPNGIPKVDARFAEKAR